MDARLAIALDGLTAYLATTSSLQSIDLSTGHVTAKASAQHPILNPETYPTVPPLLCPLGARQVALTAFLETATGPAATAGHPVVELVTMDTATPHHTDNAVVGLPAGVASTSRGTEHGAHVIGVRGTTAIIGVEDASSAGAVIAVDLLSKRLLWAHPAFVPATVTDSTVVGLADIHHAAQRLRALNLLDGSLAWTAPTTLTGNPAITSLGPKLVGVSGSDAATGAHVLQLDSTVSGHTANSITAAVNSPQCLYDDRSAIVCAAPNQSIAFDAGSGRILWRLADTAGHQVAPDIATAWHGLVYARTDNGPEYLDARRGTRRPSPMAVDPLEVDQYVALVVVPAGTGTALLAYPATG